MQKKMGVKCGWQLIKKCEKAKENKTSWWWLLEFISRIAWVSVFFFCPLSI
jgi:hypothetical protein